MKKTVLFSLLLFSCTLFAQPPWTQRSNFAGNNRSGAVAFGIGDNGYVGTGYDNLVFKKGFFAFNIINNGWYSVAALGGPNGGGEERNLATSFVISNKGYVTTGQGGIPFIKDLWQYDPTNDTWTQKADFGGTARRAAVGFSIGIHGYVGTGQDANGLKSDFWKYDATNNNWTSVAPMPGGGRQYAVGFSISNKGYVGTGDKGTMANDFYEYDPQTDQWTQKASFAGTPRKSAVGFSIGTRGYIGSGYDTTLSYKNDFWKYDQATNSWTADVSCPGVGRSAAIGFSVGGRAFFGTGYSDGNQLNDFWEFNPDLVSVQEEQAYHHAVSVYPNPARASDKIFISSASEMKGAVQLFDPTGKLVMEKKVSGKKCELEKGPLLPGLYFYSYCPEKGNRQAGKIILTD